ncbi:MAG: cobalt ECF transporter T component CbiQ [Chloroflexota bacterium]
MKFGLDEYADLNSPIHRWDQRYKLVGLLVLIFGFSAIQDLRLLPVMIAVTVILFFISGLPQSFLLTRLKLPGFFLLALVLILPFVSGETTIWQLGPISLRQEGLVRAVLIAARFICIITLSVILFGTAPFLTSVRAMRALKLSDILVDMILLTYRYLFEIGDHLNTMRTAMRLRGFAGSAFNRRNLTVLASLVGSLLIRSYEQSERVYKAMVLRGYGAGIVPPDAFQARLIDGALTLLVILVTAMMLVVQYWLQNQMS